MSSKNIYKLRFLKINKYIKRKLYRFYRFVDDIDDIDDKKGDLMDEKLTFVNLFTNDIWQFFKQHADVKDTDEYWAGVVADAEVLEQRYGKADKHMHNIILEVLDALDERGKEL